MIRGQSPIAARGRLGKDRTNGNTAIGCGHRGVTRKTESPPTVTPHSFSTGPVERILEARFLSSSYYRDNAGFVERNCSGVFDRESGVTNTIAALRRPVSSPVLSGSGAQMTNRLAVRSMKFVMFRIRNT